MGFWNNLHQILTAILFGDMTEEQVHNHESPIAKPQPQEPAVEAVVSNSQKLYNFGKNQLGKRIALDHNVDPKFGCATAVSYCLFHVKFTSIPKAGISGTASMLEWFLNHPNLYERVPAPSIGTIIISPTGVSAKGGRGHVGIVGKESIMSNDSQSGEWHAYWNLQSWEAYYGKNLGIPTYFFNLL